MKRNIKVLIHIGLIIQLSIINCQLSTAQCAMCKSTVESNQKEQVILATQKAQGLNTGILYLMILPYILFSIIGYMWYKNSKKEREEKAKIEAALKRAINH